MMLLAFLQTDEGGDSLDIPERCEDHVPEGIENAWTVPLSYGKTAPARDAGKEKQSWRGSRRHSHS